MMAALRALSGTRALPLAVAFTAVGVSEGIGIGGGGAEGRGVEREDENSAREDEATGVRRKEQAGQAEVEGRRESWRRDDRSIVRVLRE